MSRVDCGDTHTQSEQKLYLGRLRLASGKTWNTAVCSTCGVCSVWCTKLTTPFSLGLFRTRYGDFAARLLLAMMVLMRLVAVAVAVTRWAVVHSVCPASLAQQQVRVEACSA